MKSRNPLPVVATLAAFLLSSACAERAADAPPAAAGAAGGEAAAPAAPEPAGPAALPRTPAPAGARVFFITPADGATVSSPVGIEFGIEGMTVVRAGDATPASGHHHLLVDTGLPDLDQPIPADANHIHFGDASTSTELALQPGRHTLRLLLGDHLHRPHDPPVTSATITITVE